MIMITQIGPGAVHVRTFKHLMGVKAKVVLN